MGEDEEENEESLFTLWIHSIFVPMTSHVKARCEVRRWLHERSLSVGCPEWLIRDRGAVGGTVSRWFVVALARRL